MITSDVVTPQGPQGCVALSRMVSIEQRRTVGCEIWQAVLANSRTWVLRFLLFPHGPGPAFPNSANVDTIVCAHISNETSCSIHDIRLYDKDSHQVYVNEHCS